MKILIVAATELEIRGLVSKLKKSDSIEQNLWGFSFGKINFRVLVTGIGGCASTYNLLKELNNEKYDYVLNIGLAGTLNLKITIGSVVNVVSDCFADLGSDDKGNFLSVFDLKLENENSYPFFNGRLLNVSIPSFVGLPMVIGQSVNKVSGDENNIIGLKEKFNADVETMEGAAIAYTCLLENTPFLQIRAVSNIVAPREKQNWNTKDALENLHETVFELIEKFDNE